MITSSSALVTSAVKGRCALSAALSLYACMKLGVARLALSMHGCKTEQDRAH
ncbi:hypothetical protein DICSQDRAFT_134019 [Dichomitus squalens LYAD-421 SS1]|uniref:uncharacterized protein n=1 Tax=Dichomitus squalens (strain LYAD-421) TaxID=732165 RepID=UPI00044131A9|nr:uncharacterized protein DICSQDRAFT_134019 [Dichomitus squalens LYAD-421 SS1]EJF64339.1 hypothetical protein DICSQDRAFT_134019 [Dichomitus squalens LYAD-421 SS1]